ncbi:MAG: O-antigen ligase family protein [Patescibacteria group bacterium]
MFNKLANYLLIVFVFLLPWQTRFIYNEMTINGELWEYGKLSIYGIEAILLIVFLLRKMPQFDLNKIKLSRSALIFLGACFISVSFGMVSGLGLGSIIHLIFATMLFVVLIDERTQVRSLLWAFVLGLVFPCALGWYQVITGGSPASSFFGIAVKDASELGASVIETGGARLLRAYGLFSHPNIFGGYLAAGILVLMYLYSVAISPLTKGGSEGGLSDTDKVVASFSLRFMRRLPPSLKLRRAGKPAATKLLFVLLTTLLPSTLIITFSRSAWIGAFVGIIIFIIMNWKKTVSIGWFSTSLWLCATVAVLATALVFNGAVYTRFSAQTRLETQSVQERISSMDLYDDVLRRNIFTGVGVGQYTVALATVLPDKPVWDYQPIHNSFLLFFAEVGILGVMAFLIFMHTGFKAFFTSTDDRRVLGFSLVICFLFIGLFDHYLWSMWSGLVLMYFLFGILSCSKE